MTFRILLGFTILFLTHLSLAHYTYEFSKESTTERLRTDVYTLASDDMEGREAGTKGEKMAASYIKEQMQEIGLQPLFDESFFQHFKFYGERSLGPDNFLVINDQQFELGEDFFVMPNAFNGTVNIEAVYVGFGMETEKHNDYDGLSDLKGKIFIMEMFLPEVLEDHARTQRPSVMYEKIDRAVDKGASAIIFVNTDSWRNDPNTRLNQNMEDAPIPILFAKDEVFEFWQQNGRDKFVFLATEMLRESYTAVNVAGYWDNDAEHTVVIGGHYDHLGFGGTGSRSSNERIIHPGADDNASGIAAMLEASRFLTNSDLTANNYLFIAFSAEEKGLLGSRYFANSDAYDMNDVNYMFNFDMIGRLENNSLSLIGTGSSPVWDEIIDSYSAENLIIRKNPGGIGGSDHTNFYLQDIPVLFYFTGIHEDYHRPGDTPDKINYQGMTQILSLSYFMIEKLENKGKLEFSSTQQNARTRERRE